VGALGHFLEREGIPTTGISLVREHTEVVRPPRALWVTFDLGRPLGAPDDPGLQRRVLRAALDLLQRTDGPLIVDYPEDAPTPTDFSGWSCPIDLRPPATDANDRGAALLREIGQLAGWYDRVLARRGRTTVGLSGLDMEAAGRLVASALDGALPPSQELKEAVDDLKAYYLEAAAGFPDPGSDIKRKAWFWSETQLASMLLALQPRLAASEDAGHKILANLTLIPATERHRLRSQ